MKLVKKYQNRIYESNYLSPSISVILPVYNGELYLKSAIQSILNQSFEDYELLLIDNASTDNSKNIIEHFASLDKRVRPIYQPKNLGLVSSLNRGIELSKSNLLARMDADDLAFPERFKIQFDYMAVHPEVAVLGTNINIISKDGGFIRKAYYPTSETELLKMLERGCPVAHPTVMMRKVAVEKVGGYRPAFTHAEDYDLWLRIVDGGFKIINLPKILLNYRQHETKISSVHRQQQALVSMIARMCHHARILGVEDPVETETQITEELIELFPKIISNKFKEEMFETFYGNISFASNEEILSAINKSKDFPKKTLQGKALTRFHIRCARGFFANKSYGLMLQSSLKAFEGNPRQFVKFFLEKLQTKFYL